jgi:ribosome-associated translation inhibitor RaiA
MHIQINTDENINGKEELVARISAQVHDRLDRFSQHITRIEVHLSDSNGDKSGPADKRCLIEVRLEGRQPEAVSDQAATLESAYSGAINKLQRSLESTLGKLNHHKGGDTIRTGATPDAKSNLAEESSDPRKPKDYAIERPSESVAVDRPGFDLGGSTGKTNGGTGLGLGQDAFESRRGRSLPGRRGKSN